MENLLSIGIDGHATNYGSTFQRCIQVLEESGCSYVLVGAIALDTYVNPRFTDEIDVLCHVDEWLQIETALTSSGFLHNQSCRGNSTFITDDGKVRLSLCGNNSRACLHAVANPVCQQIFDVTARIASPLSLLWIFLESNELRRKSDALTLIESGLVSPDEIRLLLDQNGASTARVAFEQFYADIQSGKFASTYSDSVKARIVHRQKRPL